MFHLQSSYLRFSMVQQFLPWLPRIRSRWFLIIRSGKSSLPFNDQPTKVCNHKKNRAYPNLVNSICHRVDLYRLVKLLTSTISDYFKISTFLIDEHEPRYIYFTKFPIRYTLTVSSSFSIVTALLEGLTSSMKPWFFSQIKIEPLILSERRSTYFILYDNTY